MKHKITVAARVTKYIEVEVEADSREEAEAIAAFKNSEDELEWGGAEEQLEECYVVDKNDNATYPDTGNLEWSEDGTEVVKID